MKDGFFTKDSVFTEIKEVVDYLSKSNLKTKESLPAIIVLEKQLDGMNKHAICGRLPEIITLFEWGISQYATQNDVSFDEIMKLINVKHNGTDHIVLHSEKYDK